MTNLKSVFKMDWSARTVVEASAGTGKTYTIVGIFIRLLVEKGVDLDQILVMTFTNKATAELRGRILERLRECVEVIQTEDGGNDPFLNEFYQQVEKQDTGLVLNRLKTAIQNFDDSRVFTIHGFCQKVLSEEALLAGVPFDMEIVQNDDLLLQAAEDYWRTFIDQHDASDAGKYYIKKMQNIARTPEDLIGRDGLGDLFNQNATRIEGVVIEDPVSYLDEVIQLRNKLKEEWHRSKQEIVLILEKCDIKRYGGYLQGRMEKLENFFQNDSYDEDAPSSLEYFTSDYLYDEERLRKDGIPTARHPFFELCNRYYDLIKEVEKVETTLIHRALKGINERREELLKNSGTLTYNDLLITLQDALKNDERGPVLAQKLLKSYPYALVDEFQDTDSVQYSIFDAIYPKEGADSSLMMIGDPKQAIYAFRGADIYTYFKAKKEGNPEFYTLNHNYRSSEKLINAVNALFDDNERKTFIEKDIQFFRSESGDESITNEYLREGEPIVPFQITMHPGLLTNKDEANEFAFNQTAKQIAELLESGKTQLKDKNSKKMRDLEAGDIAILVNSHRDALEIKNRLKNIGIDAVTYSQEKVFDTFEAKRLEVVMYAVLNPYHRTALNNALLSGLYGTDLNRLHQIVETEVEREFIRDELIELEETWNRHGFLAMFRSLLYREGRVNELAGLRNSERILTNLHQIADICSKIETDQNFDPHSLYTWYLKEMHSTRKDDEQTLLLESDRNLVKISTIHGSKGLEFPVVFCPVLWQSRDHKKQKFYSYHKGGSRVINIDRYSTEERAEAEKGYLIESTAEEVRKAYVALTRAKYECRVIWPTHVQSHLSGMGASLLGRDEFIDKAESKMKEGDEDFSEKNITGIFRGLADNYPEYILLDESDDDSRFNRRIEWNRERDFKIEPKKYTGRPELPVQNKVESFSSLSGHKSEAGEPDYDQITEWFVDARNRSVNQIEDQTIFSFPRGALPGTAIHKLFEHERFDFKTALSENHKEIIEEVIEDYGIPRIWTDVLQEMIYNVVGADYNELTLSDVTRQDQLREMEFHFPVSEPDTESLLAIIRGEAAFTNRNIGSKNFLTGFIDLIVRQNGKYYILDYKSNHLGDSPENYTSGRLQNEIQSANYDLQYHLYTLALVKYLQKRDPGFNYEKDFGGVMYLFVRGMSRNSGNGIWFHKPGKKVIDKLDAFLQRQPAEV